ncbi:hypothetical protein VC83_07202 [Pseudogymnoascus destructans]|uniref:Allergen n=2 Tax=Pseudogymnoascus destructans TaxID=655981 RepID=L8FUK9_PSED2|nr:uncharacterized protein VC83_07202 [Pseudogymnoascus destructans]ELR03436.1 hypothetical protein GMDG_06171 [Pseudogymnoascus destructans 20631-21]OAF56631.1 hypothetical protein VC83_07202 [Pseudogymnoascus destructans]
MDNAVNAVGRLFARPNQAVGESSTTNSYHSSASTSTNHEANASRTGNTSRNENSSSNRNANSNRNTTTNNEEDTTLESEVSPAVEHRHVKKQHETREQTFIHKDKHQDHYHTTIQPLKDSETLPEKHDRTQETRRRSTNNDHSDAKKKAEAGRSGFKNTTDQEQFETKTKEPTQEDVHIHNHWHETVQPVIEKEVIDPSITHRRIDMEQSIQEPAKYHGVTTNAAVSAEEFTKKHNVEKK